MHSPSTSKTVAQFLFHHHKSSFFFRLQRQQSPVGTTNQIMLSRFATPLGVCVCVCVCFFWNYFGSALSSIFVVVVVFAIDIQDRKDAQNGYVVAV